MPDAAHSGVSAADTSMGASTTCAVGAMKKRGCTAQVPAEERSAERRGHAPAEVGDNGGGAVGVQLALQPARAGQQLLQVVQPPRARQVVPNILRRASRRSI